MKLFKFLPLAAVACLAVSCQNGSNGLSGSASQTDSLMYYLGQMNGAEYVREANRDTTMKEEGAKQAYINGVRAGLAALKEGDEQYNRGVMLGIQMASQMMSFSEQMDVNINRRSYVNSLTDAVMADTLPNMNEIQTQFRKVMENIENAKKMKDETASRESLKTEAQKAGLNQIDDDLYGKVTNTVTGDSVKNLTKGNEITLQASITKADGEPLNMPIPPKGLIGERRGYTGIVEKALETLKSGETGEFMTTVHALMGPRARQMNLEPTDVVKITLTPEIAPLEVADDKKPEAKK